MKKLIAIALIAASSAFGQFYWSNQSPAGVSENIWCVTYAAETFAAVSEKGRVLTSSDGLSWSVQTVSSNVWLVSISYGAGLWVAVGDSGAIFYSADLKSWTAARAITTARLNGVSYNGSVFVAVGENGGIYTSPNAQTWTARSSGVTSFLHGIWCQPPTKIGTGANVSNYSRIFVSGANSVVLTSEDDGVTWTQLPVSGPVQGAYFEVLTARPASTTSRALLVGAGGGGAIILSGVNQNPFAVGSASQVSFTGSVLPTPSLIRGLAYGGGHFVAAGTNGSLFSSPDGLIWTSRFSGDSPSNVTTETLLSVAYAETLQRFVAVGTGGTVLVSGAPLTTIVNVATRGTVVAGDPLIGGFSVQGTASKNVLIRAVGPTLASFSVPSPLADPVLTVYDSQNRIVATNTGWTTVNNLTALVAATARAAFPLGANSKDSALYLTLAPGNYSAVITSASGKTGTALFEAYLP